MPSPKTLGSAWVKGKPLGAGSFGTVFKAFDSASLQLFAVKEVLLEDPGHHGSKQRERVSVELRICQSLRHPNIVSYLGHKFAERHLYIYLEFMPGGSVSAMLSEFGALQGDALCRAATDTLRGLDFLHTRSPPVVHRDLKGANLLVGVDMSIKLADFGCSKWSSDTNSFTMLGSLPWMAPEVIRQSEGHGRKADIWSFGCTVIEMATAEKPWGNGAFDNMMFALNHIANSECTPHLAPDCAASPACWSAVAACTQRSAVSRPSTTDLLQHAFFATSSGRGRQSRMERCS